jgi:hypothetical protein
MMRKRISAKSLTLVHLCYAGVGSRQDTHSKICGTLFWSPQISTSDICRSDSITKFCTDQEASERASALATTRAGAVHLSQGTRTKASPERRLTRSRREGVGRPPYLVLLGDDGIAGQSLVQVPIAPHHNSKRVSFITIFYLLYLYYILISLY